MNLFCKFCPQHILSLESKNTGYNYFCFNCDSYYFVVASLIKDYMFIHKNYLIIFDFHIPFAIYNKQKTLPLLDTAILILDFIPDITPFNVKTNLPKILNLISFI